MADREQSAQGEVAGETSPGLLAGIAVCAFGLGVCVTMPSLVMKAVADFVGPTSASVVRVSGEQVPWLWVMPVSIIGGALFAIEHTYLSSKAGGFSLLVAVWSGLFLSLGWDFLYMATPPMNPGWNVGFLVCGAVFGVMGAVPLVGYFDRGPAGAGHIAPRGRDGTVDERATRRFRILYTLLNVVPAAAGVATAIWLMGRLAG